jgi:capsular polysaccharide transport system permease protein
MMVRARTPSAAPREASPAQLPANAGGATVTPLFLPVQLPSSTSYLPRRLVSLRELSFFLVVLLPTAVAAIYYLAIAADQYVAEFRMSLRSADTPRIEPLVLFGGSTPQPTAAAESQIVAQFIASRAIVDELNPKLDLTRLFSPPEADWWARLPLPASIERLVYYWQYHVDPFYDTSTATIIVRVRAFSPNDALRLAQGIVSASEGRINDLSARARQDALEYAQADVAIAEERLKMALTAIRDFRDKEGLIDPGKAADNNSLLATKLRDDQLKANSELASKPICATMLRRCRC